MLSMFTQLWKDEEGPTAVEYALMVALIAVVIILGATFLGEQVNIKFSQVGSAVSGAGAGGGGGGGTP